ncbi:hypothetical protein BDZ91DRAFT_491343 [Kalaharituber pfeilii]|nr:hypothetical protein BDZ91DRAFT_491343 [Kalaharituber pfeilii]
MSTKFYVCIVPRPGKSKAVQQPHPCYFAILGSHMHHFHFLTKENTHLSEFVASTSNATELKRRIPFNMMVQTKRAKLESFSETQYHELLCRFLISINSPIKLVAMASFLELLQYCNPKVQKISARTIHRDILKLYNKTREGVIQLLCTHKESQGMKL